MSQRPREPSADPNGNNGNADRVRQTDLRRIRDSICATRNAAPQHDVMSAGAEA
jgi:hypothetical protein